MDINWDFALYMRLDDKQKYPDFIIQSVNQFKDKYGIIPVQIKMRDKPVDYHHLTGTVNGEKINIPILDDHTVQVNHVALYKKSLK